MPRLLAPDDALLLRAAPDGVGMIFQTRPDGNSVSFAEILIEILSSSGGRV